MNSPDYFILLSAIQTIGATSVQVNWSDLGLKGKLSVRDLWRQKDLGKFKNTFSATVPRHGVVLIKVK